MAAGGKGVQGGMLMRIALTWVITLPVTMVVPAGLFYVLRLRRKREKVQRDSRAVERHGQRATEFRSENYVETCPTGQCLSLMRSGPAADAKLRIVSRRVGPRLARETCAKRLQQRPCAPRY